MDQHQAEPVEQGDDRQDERVGVRREPAHGQVRDQRRSAKPAPYVQTGRADRVVERRVHDRVRDDRPGAPRKSSMASSVPRPVGAPAWCRRPSRQALPAVAAVGSGHALRHPSSPGASVADGSAGAVGVAGVVRRRGAASGGGLVPGAGSGPGWATASGSGTAASAACCSRCHDRVGLAPVVGGDPVAHLPAGDLDQVVDAAVGWSRRPSRGAPGRPRS